MAVDNGRKDMHSNVGALYIDSLNRMFDVQTMRVAVGLHARIPTGIWLVLFVLVILGMLGVGYQSGVAGSGRSWTMLILALSFSIVIALIATLDRPSNGLITVSQQPMEHLRASMAEDMDKEFSGDAVPATPADKKT